MPTYDLDITTDENGYIHKTKKLNPPGPFGFSVKLTATLTSPAETTIEGSIDIDAIDGSPTNPKRPFVATTGATVDLGSWSVDGGDNVIVLEGKTRPVRAKTKLNVTIRAQL